MKFGEKSLEYAQSNVRSNNIHNRVSVVQLDPADSILCHVLGGHSSISTDEPGLVFMIIERNHWGIHDISQAGL